MYKQISKNEFEEVMCGLTGQEIWLKVFTDTISVDLCYPEFEFLSFSKGEYLFGHKTYDEEHELQYQNVVVDIDNVCSIHRCVMSPSLNAEQIILELMDETQLILELECMGEKFSDGDKIILPKCNKCGNEIHTPEETIWNIFGNANYGSYYDDREENEIVNSLVFCDICVFGFVGEIKIDKPSNGKLIPFIY